MGMTNQKQQPEIAYQLTIFRERGEDGAIAHMQFGPTREQPSAPRGWMLDAVDKAHEIICSHQAQMRDWVVAEFRKKEAAVEEARGKMAVVDVEGLFRGPEPPRAIPKMEEASPFWEKPGRPVDQGDGGGGEGEDEGLE
jgi:hypothetical protein